MEEEEVLCFLFVYLVADGMFGTLILDTRPINYSLFRDYFVPGSNTLTFGHRT